MSESVVNWSSFESDSAVMADSHCMLARLGAPIGCAILGRSRDREWDNWVFWCKRMSACHIVVDGNRQKGGLKVLENLLCQL